MKSCSWMGRTTSLSIESRVRLDEADGLWLRSASSQAPNSLEIEPRRWLPGGPHTATAGDLIGLALAPPEELPPLLFNETDVARLVAAVEMDATKRAQAECAIALEMQRDRSVARAADALAAALAVHRADEAATLGCIVELSEAMVQALTADGRAAAELGAMIQSMLATAAAAPALRIVTCPADECMVNALLPDVVVASGFTGGIEVVAEPRLPSGAVQLIWADGWLEHALEVVRRRIDAVVAPHRSTSAVPVPLSAAACGFSPSCATMNGVEDAGD